MVLISVDNSVLPPRLTYPKFEFAPDEPVDDPDIHLSLTEPDFIVLLDGWFRYVAKAPKLDRPPASNGDSQLGYTAPFRLLSDEGDARQTAYICNAGYRSKWIQDFISVGVHVYSTICRAWLEMSGSFPLHFKAGTQPAGRDRFFTGWTRKRKLLFLVIFNVNLMAIMLFKYGETLLVMRRCRFSWFLTIN